YRASGRARFFPGHLSSSHSSRLPQLPPGLPAYTHRPAFRNADQLPGRATHHLDLILVLTDAGDHGRGLDDVDIGSNGGRRDTNVVPVLILDGNPVIVIEFAIVIQVEHGVIQAAAVEGVELHQPAVAAEGTGIRIRHQGREDHAVTAHR